MIDVKSVSIHIRTIIKMRDIRRNGLPTMAFDYGKIDIAVQKVLSVMNPTKIILFGSAARGEASTNSDIDLIIVLESEDTIEDSIQAKLAMSPIGVPVDILVYTPEEFTKRSVDIHSVVHDAICEGKILYGTA